MSPHHLTPFSRGCNVVFGELPSSLCVSLRCLSSVQVMEALFFRGKEPSCELGVMGARAGMRSGGVGETCSVFDRKGHFESWNTYWSKVWKTLGLELC